MTVADNLFNNRDRISYTNAFDVDKVVDVVQSVVTVNLNASGYATFPGTFNFIGKCFPIGIFSYDGGTVWNDFTDYVSADDPRSKPTMSLVPYIRNDGTFYFEVYSRLPNQTKQIMFKLLLLDYTGGTINAMVAGSTPGFTSEFSYPIIKETSTANVVFPFTATFAHSLGYVPIVRLFQNKDGDPTYVTTDYNNSAITYDATNIYFINTGFAGNGTNYRRIYYGG